MSSWSLVNSSVVSAIVSGGVASLLCPIGWDVTPGNLLVLSLANYKQSLGNITDNTLGVNTYTSRSDFTSASGASIYIFDCIVAQGGTNLTVEVNKGTGNLFPSLAIYEFSANGGIISFGTSANGTGTSITAKSLSVTPGNYKNLILGAASLSGANGIKTVLDPFKLGVNADYIGNKCMGLTVEYALDQGNNSIAANFGLNRSVNWATSLATWLIEAPSITDSVSAGGKFTWVLASGTPASVGTDKTAWAIVDQDRTLSKVSICAKTAPTGADLVVDILYSTNNGVTFTSLWAAHPANRPTLVSGANFGTTATFDTTNLTADSLLRVDIVQVGYTIPGQDITVQLQY